MKKIFLLLYIFLSSIFLLRYLLLGHAVYGDGIYYWMYARTIVIDHNLSLIEEQRHRYSPEGNNTAEVIPLYPMTEGEKRTIYHLPIGTSLGYLPFFYLAHGVGNTLGMLNVPILLNGYSHLYQVIVGLGNIFYATVGLCCLLLLLQRYVSFTLSLLTVLLMLVATNLIYYLGIDILNSHPLSFCLSSIFFLVYIPTFGKKKWYHWGILGILVGLLTATRTQEILFALLLHAEGIYTALRWYSIRRGDGVEERTGVGFAVLGFFLGFLPQLLLWYTVFGTFNVPYLERDNAFTFLNPHILGILVNFKTGLVWYTPLFLLGVGGLFLGLKREKPLFITLLLFVFCELYLIASWNAWDQAASYGMRMLITSAPLYALGLAFVSNKLLKRFSITKIMLLGLFFVLWNFCMILYFHIVVKDPTIDQGEITREKVLRRIDTVIERFTK